MKIKLLFLFTFLMAQQAFSQIGSGNLLIGGGFGFSSGENNVGFSINPTGHYFISDNVSVGGSVGFSTNRNQPGEDVYSRTSSFGVTPAIRYFKGFGEKLHIYGEASIGFNTGGTTGINGNNRTDLQSRNQFGIGIGPGLVYAPTEKIGFDLNFNLLSFNRTSTTDETNNPTTTNVNSNFSFGINSFNPAFGVYFIIGN